MLDSITAVEFQGALSSGKTKPLRVAGEAADGSVVEVVAKFSAGCEGGLSNLAMEILGACLAADLGLPIPKPYLLHCSDDWIASIPDVDRQAAVFASSRIAFGSQAVPPGFSIWTEADRVSPEMMETALKVFVFDALATNPDRRSDNPNCFVQGDQVRIFDHELAFSNRLVFPFLRKNPWAIGGLQTLERDGTHIFVRDLKGRKHDLDQIGESWQGLSNDRLKEYEAAVPVEWGDCNQAVTDALQLVTGARDNIEGCLAEVRRVLT